MLITTCITLQDMINTCMKISGHHLRKMSHLPSAKRKKHLSKTISDTNLILAGYSAKKEDFFNDVSVLNYLLF